MGEGKSVLRSVCDLLERAGERYADASTDAAQILEVERAGVDRCQLVLMDDVYSGQPQWMMQALRVLDGNEALHRAFLEIASRHNWERMDSVLLVSAAPPYVVVGSRKLFRPREPEHVSEALDSLTRDLDEAVLAANGANSEPDSH